MSPSLRGGTYRVPMSGTRRTRSTVAAVLGGVLVLGLGTAGVVFALARNRREPRLHATPADEDLIARERVEEP